LVNGGGAKAPPLLFSPAVAGSDLAISAIKTHARNSTKIEASSSLDAERGDPG
jgi:hypothetical protein